eukprot:11490154-Alexandrium_andersonii.AAC.1
MHASCAPSHRSLVVVSWNACTLDPASQATDHVSGCGGKAELLADILEAKGVTVALIQEGRVRSEGMFVVGSFVVLAASATKGCRGSQIWVR